jgi:hypothetical protein
LFGHPSLFSPLTVYEAAHLTEIKKRKLKHVFVVVVAFVVVVLVAVVVDVIIVFVVMIIMAAAATGFEVAISQFFYRNPMSVRTG